MRDKKERFPVVPGIMKINTGTQVINMQHIDNRRFMYNPKTRLLVLGRQYTETRVSNSSHAQELADAGITKDYDDFVRGWIGTGGDYPNGVIHFAPSVAAGNMTLFERAFDTLEMFRENGAGALTVVRGFGSVWEQPFHKLLPPCKEAEKKPSVREQLKQGLCGQEHGTKKKAPARER